MSEERKLEWPEPREDPEEEPFEPWARPFSERDWPWRERSDTGPQVVPKP